MGEGRSLSRFQVESPETGELWVQRFGWLNSWHEGLVYWNGCVELWV